MNWLHGTPSTVKPAARRTARGSPRAASYWGVSPHFEATLTIRLSLAGLSRRAGPVSRRGRRGRGRRWTSPQRSLPGPVGARAARRYARSRHESRHRRRPSSRSSQCWRWSFVVVSAGLARRAGRDPALPRRASDARAALVPVALPFAWAIATTARSAASTCRRSRTTRRACCAGTSASRCTPWRDPRRGGAATRYRTCSCTPCRWLRSGWAISIYHYLLERFPDSVTTACTDDVPC